MSNPSSAGHFAVQYVCAGAPFVTSSHVRAGASHRQRRRNAKTPMRSSPAVAGAYLTLERRSEMANPFVHVELHTHELPKARQFYQSLFGWELRDVPMPGGGGTYTLISVGDGVGGGMMADPSVPPHWLAYIGVDDVRAKTAQAKTLGATVLQDVMEVGEMGTMSIIRDPAGAAIAMWQSKGGG
jgi:uncharacterized protein